MGGVVVRAGDPVVVAVAEGGVVGVEPVLVRLLLHLKLGTKLQPVQGLMI